MKLIRNFNEFKQYTTTILQCLTGESQHTLDNYLSFIYKHGMSFDDAYINKRFFNIKGKRNAKTNKQF